MPTDTAFGRWLRQEMPRRNYPIDGPRAGGITRLAEDTGLARASVSRLVAGRSEPSLESLQKIGELWDYTLGEMLIHAGLARPEDMTIVQRSEPQGPEPPRLAPDPSDPFAGWPTDLPEEADPRDLQPVQYQVLRYVTALPPMQRIMLAGDALMIQAEARKRGRGESSDSGAETRRHFG